MKRDIYPDILFLMETKNPDSFVLKKMKQLQYENSHLISPTGHGAGGLALFWKQEIKLQILNSSANCIDVCIEFEGKSFFASFVYGDTDKPKRRAIWDLLLERNNARDTPWFLTGDLNDLLNNDEKVGGPSRPEASFTDMRSFYSEGDLYDLRHSGDCLSWRGQRGDYLVRCRLDWAAANSYWAEMFPNARSQYLTRELIELKRSELECALTDPANDTDLISKVSNELNDAYLSEEEYWRQRSRLLWLSLSDRNTGFFHATAKNRKRANAFTVIEDDEGTMVYQEDQIGRVIVNYFHDLFRAIEGNREETVAYALSPMVNDEMSDTHNATVSRRDQRGSVLHSRRQSPRTRWLFR
ncbi:PREDICTED: uncharacterized protein LOC106323347 [Brassica oleracea var. oleracea]|uniref:uncharacterized protein LOC106323347 n=1 Tax=Brassica oleracea var. oleracea TaxID=109376 RepID=UPI0006A6E29E|nr:PREDICTED: uncharacterized protein LOC106323347 [Brassica oleracea var. oleracea]